MAAVHVWNSVMPGKTFIEKCVVGAQQIESAAIVTHDALEKQFGLAPEGLAQIIVEIRKQPGIGNSVRQITKIQPLSREVCRQRLRARIGQHAADLSIKDGSVPQSSADSEIEEFIIGNAAPQKERQSGSQFEIRD